MDVRDAAVHFQAERSEHFFGSLMATPKKRGHAKRRPYQGPTVRWSKVTVSYREPQPREL
jgi:hypothetical protein